MTNLEQLMDIPEENFPQEFGRWMEFDEFDPKFTRKELRELKKDGLIQLDEKGHRFRMTMKATKEMKMGRC